MKILIWIFILFTNISIAQSNEIFFSNFLLEDELKSQNLLKNYLEYDFSNVWKKTPNQFVYGIIGKEHQRIRIKLISINKSADKPNEYNVYGKSLVRENICEFFGKINIIKINEVKELHFGIDDKFKDKGIRKQGILIAEYKFDENSQQHHSGIFKGILYSKWYLNNSNEIVYDDIQFISDDYTNNAFIGIWKSYSNGNEKICNWADWRVPNANQDFDIGGGEFSVSKKYWNKGWIDIALKFQEPNNISVKQKTAEKTKEWWE